MKKNMIFLLLLLCNISFAAGTAQLRTGLVFESNTFYSNSGPEMDFGLVLEPSGQFKKQVGSSYVLSGDGLLTYTKYTSNSNQDFFEYDVSLGNLLLLSERWKFYVNPNAKLESEPAISKTKDRLERQYMGADTGIVYQKDDRRQWRLNMSYSQEALSQTNYKYLNNEEMRGLLTYRKYFLPETFAAFALRAGVKTYPDGEKDPTLTFLKYNSTRLEPGFAIVGRLTRYLKVRTYGGFVYLSYTKYESFKEPVFLIEFEEDLSPRDSILVGYDYTVEDSYYGNFVLLQKMYLGYSRFIGDQVLMNVSTEYLYRSFSQPYLRNDQRFVVIARGEYSYSEKLKLELIGMYDLNGSDSLNNLPVPNPVPIDPFVGYEAYNIGIFLKYSL